MQKMTHGKTWSAPLSPLVPKCTRLLDNKAEVIDRKLNSRDFHVNFISLYKLENCLTHGEPDGPLFLWCGRGQSLSLLLTNIWTEISGEFLVGHLTSPSCLPPPHREKKSLHFPRWGWWSVRTSGCFQSRPQAPVWRYTITRRNWKKVLSPLTKLPSQFGGFPRRCKERETLSNPNISQPTLFHINL